jgi:outer membrane protein assembly factor BamB
MVAGAVANSVAFGPPSIGTVDAFVQSLNASSTSLEVLATRRLNVRPITGVADTRSGACLSSSNDVLLLTMTAQNNSLSQIRAMLARVDLAASGGVEWNVTLSPTGDSTIPRGPVVNGSRLFLFGTNRTGASLIQAFVLRLDGANDSHLSAPSEAWIARPSLGSNVFFDAGAVFADRLLLIERFLLESLGTNVIALSGDSGALLWNTPIVSAAGVPAGADMGLAASLGAVFVTGELQAQIGGRAPFLARLNASSGNLTHVGLLTDSVAELAVVTNVTASSESEPL